jgi:serine phosphatase RsbU (regulator of sigma subunit)/putative methionine-R-sulfoxide reductase with GAF domain
MHQRERDLLLTFYCLAVGAGGLAALAWACLAATASLSPLVFFLLTLSFLVKRLGFRVAADVTHGLGTTVDVAATLILGAPLGGLVAGLSGLAFAVSDAWTRRQWTRQALADVPFFNGGLKALIALGSGLLFQAVGGTFSPSSLELPDLLRALVLFVSWVVLDHVGWGILELLRLGSAGLLEWLRRVMLASLLVELLPLPMSLLIAVIYGGLGTVAFLVAALVLLGLALVVARLAEMGLSLGERVQELSALNRMGEAVLRARLDVDALCELIYQQASDIVDTSTFHLALFDGDDYTLKVWVRRGKRQPQATFHLAGDEGIAGWMRRSKQPLLVRDFDKEMKSLPARPRYISTEPPLSAVFVPLIIGDQVTGTITIQSYRRAAFTENHLRLLANIANQAAAALENARLYQAVQEEAWHLNALLQVAENVAAITDLREMLATIVRLIPLLVGVERCAILLCDGAGDHFLATEAYGLDSEELAAFRTLNCHHGESGPFQTLWETRQAVKVGQDDPLLPKGLGMASPLLVPLLARGGITGVICVDQGAGAKGLSARQEAILTGIANQAAVAIENAQLQVQADEKERLQHEVDLARQIQSSLLPACCPSIHGYDLDTDWRGARQVSGDFYDFFPLPGNKWGILIADVSDKGMAAALFMALSRSLIRSGLIGGDPPAHGLKRANGWILSDTTSGLFVTVFYLVLDVASHQITYVSCGHNPPLLVRGTGSDVLWLRGKGIALGVTEEISLEEQTVALERNDTLLLYTDGITEATNAAGEFFGVGRLLQALAGSERRPASQTVAAVRDAVTDFVGAAPQSDDITLVALRRTH